MSDVKPLISVLVPIYKVEAYIEKCVKSLFGQTYENIEYIFVDDCTPDNSIAVLQSVMEKYPCRRNRTRIIRNATNQGIAAVRNILLENATGEYVIFIDSDDWVELSMIENLVNEAQATDADIVCCDLIVEYEGRSVNCVFGLRDNKLDNFKDISSGTLTTYLYLLLTKRSLYVDNNLTFYKGINLCEDYIMYNRLFHHADKIVYHPHAYYHYYRGNPNSYTQPSLQNIRDRVNAIKVVEQYLESIGVLVAVRNDLNIRKFLTKKDFIFNSGLRNFDEWRRCFPEVNFCWKDINVGLKNRIIYFLVSVYCDALARFVLKCR